MGWYRMHQTIFTTTHISDGTDFFRVHWLRYPLAEIREHPSHRRIRNRNKAFRYTTGEATRILPEHVALYAKYHASINFNGAASIQQALFGEEGVEKSIYQTHCISIYDQDTLIAAGYVDVGESAGTSILHFFDPAYRKYSLGKYLMLLTTDLLKASGCAFYYPGYLVSGVPKMDYKLFLGKEATYYFDPSTGTWNLFEERICAPEVLTEEDLVDLIVGFTEP